jgi:hypothetical protein
VEDITHIGDHALGVYYPGDLDVELMSGISLDLSIKEQAGDYTFEVAKEDDSYILLIEEKASTSIDVSLDGNYDVTVIASGTIIYHPTNTYLPQVKTYLENPNDLTGLFIGAVNINNMFAAKSHTHSMSDITDYTAPTGGGMGYDPRLDQWFELVNPGLPNEYLRVKKPVGADYELQAYTNNGQFGTDLPGLFANIPWATDTSIGGIKYNPAQFYRNASDQLTIIESLFGTGTGTDTRIDDWFELVNPGLVNEYLRVKKAVGGDYEIQAFTNSGQMPPNLWAGLPIATATVLGGIKVGANLTIDAQGVLSGLASGGESFWEQSETTSNALKPISPYAYIEAVGILHPTVVVISAPSIGLTFDNIYLKYLPAKTTELNVVYYDTATGKLSYGTPAPTMQTANFSIVEESGKLVFKYGSTAIASLSSAGYLKALNEVETFATP